MSSKGKGRQLGSFLLLDVRRILAHLRIWVLDVRQIFAHLRIWGVRGVNHAEGDVGGVTQ